MDVPEAEGQGAILAWLCDRHARQRFHTPYALAWRWRAEQKVCLERNEEAACESGLGGQGATRRSAPDCSLTASTVTEASFRPEAVTQGVFSLMLVAPSGNLATAPLGFAATAYE